MSNAIFDRIIIRSAIRTDGTLGGEYEYDPYLATWCSFDPYRVERIYPFELSKDQPNFQQNKDDIHTRLGFRYNTRALRHATRQDKFNAFLSMVSFNDSKTVKEDQHGGGEPIIDVPLSHIQVYDSSSDIIIDKVGDYDKMRGDASIWFKLMTKTRYSGIEQIDKTDAKYAERTIPDGILSIELYKVFAQYLDTCYNKGCNTFNYDTVYIDPKVTGLFIHEQRENKNNKLSDSELIQKAYEATYKAMTRIQITIEGFNYDNYKKSIFAYNNLNETHIHAFLPTSSSSSSKSFGSNASSHSSKSSSSLSSSNGTQLPSSTEFKPYLYSSKTAQEGMMKHLGYLVQVYCNSFISTDDKVAKYKPLNQKVSNLQLLVLTSEQGQMPIVSYFTDTSVFTREYHSQEERINAIKLYGHNDDTEKHFKMMLNSSLRRHGISKEVFIEKIDSHYLKSNTLTNADPQLITCLKVIIDAGTFAANSAYYTADYRNIPVYDKKTSSYHKDHVLRKAIDSFDNEILNLSSKSDDCEGQSSVGTTILESFSYGRFDIGCHYSSGGKSKKNKKNRAKRYDYTSLMNNNVYSSRFGIWKSRLLQRAQLVLNNHHITNVGSLVTSAYVDNDNKAINIKDRDLPIINDQLDRNAHCDGHCFACSLPSYTMKTMLSNGNNEKAVVESVKPYHIVQDSSSLSIIQDKDFFKREKTMPILTLEGTGSIDPTVLPINEFYGDNELERRRATTEKLFIKSLKARLIELGHGVDISINNDETKERDALMSMFQAEGLSFYIEKQPLNRRVSSFYTNVVHGVFAKAYVQNDVTLSQAAFCKKDNQTGEVKYGVNMGELLRSSKSSNANGISLISPYRNSRKEWINETIPMMESIQNQMPLMAFGRYTKEQYENETYSVYIDPSLLKSTYKWKFPTTIDEIKAIKSSCPNQAKFHAISENKNQVIIRFYSRVWKMNKSTEDMMKLQSFIEKSPGLKDYGYFIEKHLPNCDPMVEILCIIDMNEFDKQHK